MNIKEFYNELTIIEKIYFRGNALHFLTWIQYSQLTNLNKLILAPYYRFLLIQQGRHVADTENFKASHNGKNRYEYENGI